MVRLARCTRLMPRSISPNTTARAEPPAPSTSASSALSQPGAQASRLLIKPSTSVLVEHSSPSSIPQRIGGADRAGALVRLRQRQRALLVRNGDVGADEAAQRQPEHEILELVGRHRLDDVAALDAERAQPVMMDQRRARMRGRPSDQARGGGFGHGNNLLNDVDGRDQPGHDDQFIFPGGVSSRASRRGRSDRGDAASSTTPRRGARR